VSGKAVTLSVGRSRKHSVWQLAGSRVVRSSGRSSQSRLPSHNLQPPGVAGLALQTAAKV